MKWTRHLADFFANSLQRKLTLAVSVLVTLLMVVFGFYLINTQRQTATAELDARAARTVDLLAQTVALPLWNIDKDSINAQLNAVMTDPEVSVVSIYETGASEPLLSANRGENTAVTDPIIYKAEIFFQNGADKVSLGIIQMEYSRELLNRSLARTSILIGIIILALIFLLIISIYFLANRLVITPLLEMTTFTSLIAAGDLTGHVNLASRDEMSILASSLNSMTAQLRELIGSLEQRVADRTKDLVTVAEVGTATSTILELDKLLQNVVDLTKERFNLYHAHIYLLDEKGENLVLARGAGEPGRQMLEKGLFIPLDREQSLVARAARDRKGVTVNDVRETPDFLPNPLLPDTRSELAVPMIVGGNVIGVFDVQSDQVGRFAKADVDIQTALAAQVAVSVQNTRQVQEGRKLQEQYSLAIEGANDGIWDWDIESNRVIYSPRWKEMIGYQEDELNNGFADFEALLHPEDHERVLANMNDYLTGKVQAYDLEFRFRHKDGSYRWIRMRGKALRRANGAPYRMAGSHTDITESKLARENAAKRAEQQESINFISQRIQAATTIEDAMQVAARELGHALGMKSTLVTLDPSALADGQETSTR